MSESSALPPPPSSIHNGPKPLRAMLARGGACDLCRARKVKCDGNRPVCSQCTKSARGSSSEINCVYDGGARGAGGKKRLSATNASNGCATNGASTTEPTAMYTVKPVSAPIKKRDRASVNDEEDFQDEIETTARQELGTRNGSSKKRAPTGGHRVETLVERISELERRLRLQSQPVPAAVHTHVRASASPPFYPSPYLPSVPMEARRSHTGAEPTAKDIAAAWTPESSVRFTTGRQADSVNAPVRSSAYGAPAYASFIPPLPHLAAFEEEMPGFNGSSYPPLNYSNELNPNTSGFSAAALATTNGGPHGPAEVFGQPNHSNSTLLDSNFTNSSSTEHSLAPSPEDYLSLSLDASLLQLFYPAWPPTLPSPSTVHHLVSVFFNRAAVPSAMFSRGRITAALELAPLDPSFPNTALLHAICAYASPWVSTDALSGGDQKKKYWEGESSPRQYHYRCARSEIDATLIIKAKEAQRADKGKNFFQILQATLMCCYIAYQEAAFTDLWMLSGLATRLCTPLGLNHLDPWDFAQDKCGPAVPNWRAQVVNVLGDHRDHALLPPPRDAEEHYERSSTWWVAFSIDRHTSASTDWSTSVDELDVTTPLPLLAYAPEATVSLRHEKFFEETSVSSGSHGLFIKAIILLGRVVNYLQRLPRVTVMEPGESCAAIREKMKKEPAFLELDFALAKFRALTSADFFKVDHAIDSHLASAYAIPHVASILLHEPFCDRDDRSPTSSAARCLTSAKCVINSTFMLSESSNDLSGLDPFLHYYFSVVGRAMVRDYALKRLWGDLEGASNSKTLAENSLAFTGRCIKNGTVIPILVHTSKVLQGLLDNPDQLLPTISQVPFPCESTDQTPNV